MRALHAEPPVNNSMRGNRLLILCVWSCGVMASGCEKHVVHPAVTHRSADEAGGHDASSIPSVEASDGFSSDSENAVIHENPELVLSEDPVPEAPPNDAPTDPPSVARLDALRAVVEQTDDCWNGASRAGPHVADRRCRQWFAEIERGGELGNRALAESLHADEAGIESTPDQLRPREHRLAILVSKKAVVAVRFLLRRMHHVLSHSNDDTRSYVYPRERPFVDGFEQLTGYPVNAVPSWDGSETTIAADKYRISFMLAMRWWHRVGERSAEWRAESDTRLRAWLSRDDAWSVIHAAELVAARETVQSPLVDAAISAVTGLSQRGGSANARRSAQLVLRSLRRIHPGPHAER